MYFQYTYMKQPLDVNTVVADEMVETAMREADNWSSFVEGPPFDDAMKTVLAAALELKERELG